MSAEAVTDATISASTAGRRFGQLLDRVVRRRGRAIVEQDGAPVAAIVPTDDLRRLDRLDAQRDADFAVLDGMGDAFKDVSDEEIEREVAKAIAEARAESAVPAR